MNELRTQIRREIRQRRNALSSLEQSIASQNTLAHIKQNAQFKKADHIAIYLSVDGELDTRPIINYFWQQGKALYLPVIHPFSSGHLLFLKYDKDTPMVENQYYIHEPKLDKTKVLPISQLDIIFTPLVAFDKQGQRLGMGGGYYDRSLEKWFKHHTGALPIGLAHDCQQIDSIPSESWDIPLPVIITPSKVWHWPQA